VFLLPLLSLVSKIVVLDRLFSREKPVVTLKGLHSFFPTLFSTGAFVMIFCPLFALVGELFPFCIVSHVLLKSRAIRVGRMEGCSLPHGPPGFFRNGNFSTPWDSSSGRFKSAPLTSLFFLLVFFFSCLLFVGHVGMHCDKLLVQPLFLEGFPVSPETGFST